MCGITGAYDLRGLREFPKRQLLNMTGAIAHRGPDDERIHIEPGLALGARRLAIIDPTYGIQPVCNETGDIWGVINGELFDYPLIRKELLARGHTLKSHGDTEAWVHLYEEYGEGVFEHAQGQYAVCLWDRRQRTLILGRDRVGICPLYYTERDGWLLWGSEIKALLSSGLVDAVPDHQGIDYLFNFYGAGTHRTFFKDIKLLPPGHFLRIKDGHVSLHCYWDIDFPDAGQERQVSDPQILIDEFKTILQRSIRRRLHSDVPVVSYLSGGLDSSVILGLGCEQNGSPLPSFTIGMDSSTGPNESADATEVAKLFGSKLTTVHMNTDKIVASFPEFITAAEGPVIDPSCAALMQLAHEINRQGFKVALTGEGADEALAGYIWFKAQRIDNMLGPASRLLRRLLQYTIVGSKGRGKPIAEKAVKGTRPAQQHMYEAMSMSRESFYSDHMWRMLEGHDPYEDLVIPNERIASWDPLNQSLYVGYKIMLAGMLLIAKGDRIAMNASVETRFPFLDDELIQFCAQIAPKYKLNGFTDKWLLRQVAHQALSPIIAKRAKSMFRSKLSQLFLTENRPAWVDQLLSEESLKRSGYFDPKAVQRERAWLKYPRILPRQYLFDGSFTCVISTQLWHHLFCGGNLCELPVWEPPKRD